MQELSRDEYISEIKYCYENSRWEFSFYAVLYSFFCQFRTEQIKLVHCADWKSRGANTSSFMSANLENCSIKITGNDGKKYIGGIPDFQFVPSQYSYENPYKANAFVEFKRPIFSDEGVYIPLKYKKTSEIEHQYKNCNKIIFTDGISWYFLENQKIDIPENTVNLVDNPDNWNILKEKIANFINKN